MKILFIGDVYGRPGREVIAKLLPSLKSQYNVDFAIVNGENATHGRGLSYAHYLDLVNSGADCITSGNHFFSKDYKMSYFNQTDKLVRPLNLSPYTGGSGSKVFEVKGLKIRVTNILGRVYMKDFGQTDIYKAMDELLSKNNEVIHIVDMHAEPTAEKMAFAYNYDGRVTAVLGTHTHVQTADEMILPKGSGYISDVGMSGPFRSIIGSDIDQVIIKSKSPTPVKFDVANTPAMLNAVLLDIDEDSGKCKDIQRISIKPESEE